VASHSAAKSIGLCLSSARCAGGSGYFSPVAQLNSTGMQLFKPVVLDAASMTNLKPAKGDPESHFWLVDSPASNLKRGQILDHSQLTLLITDRQKVK